jgi:GDPmannose 4,6-dehydratase
LQEYFLKENLKCNSDYFKKKLILEIFMNKKNIFIFGISGQDGSYLAHFLIKKNFNVIGFSRSNNKNNFINLKRLNILQKVKLIKYNDNNERLVEKKLLKFQPSQIYMLSGLSSVKKSFLQPIETYKSNIITLFKILEFCRKKKLKINIYNSASTDCFGNQKKICNENSNSFPLVHMLNQKVMFFG